MANPKQVREILIDVSKEAVISELKNINDILLKDFRYNYDRATTEAVVYLISERISELEGEYDVSE